MWPSIEARTSSSERGSQKSQRVTSAREWMACSAGTSPGTNRRSRRRTVSMGNIAPNHTFTKSVSA